MFHAFCCSSRRIGAVLPTARAVEYLVMGYSDSLMENAANAAKLRASLDFEQSVLQVRIVKANDK